MTPEEVDKLAEQIAQEFKQTINRTITYDEYTLIIHKLKKMGYKVLESERFYKPIATNIRSIEEIEQYLHILQNKHKINENLIAEAQSKKEWDLVTVLYNNLIEIEAKIKTLKWVLNIE